MKKENIIQQKSFAFALRIVHLYRYLTNEKKEFVLAKQALRSGTSIGANIEEAIGAQSEKDFLSKLSIAYKETLKEGDQIVVTGNINLAHESPVNVITN